MFLADYSCKIARKPINRAFHGYLWNAKNFKFGRSGDVFGKVFGIFGKVYGILEEIFGRGTDIFGILGQVFGRLQM